MLAKFRAGGRSLVLLWWGFALTAVALVQFLGLVRWPFLVPYLAEQEDGEAVDLIFQAFNRYLGVAVGEHLGYLFIGAWTTLIGVALTQTAAARAWIGAIGIVIGQLLMLCALEFVVRPRGRKVAERLTPIAYVAWSAWLIATGVALIA